MPSRGFRATSSGLTPSDCVPPAGSSSSLDRPETKAHDASKGLRTVNTAELRNAVTFRHSGWAVTRARVRRALAAGGGRLNRLEAWDRCGSNHWLVRSVKDPSIYRIHADMCRDRFCKPCASARSAMIAENLAGYMAQRRHRLITLTLRSGHQPLAQLLTLLYDSFRTLRRTELWRQRIRGGACFLEIKYNRDLERWHPHLHIIAEGSYIEQGHLAQAWHRITEHSHIVDVRLVKTTEQAARYVAKYASKPLSSSYSNDHDTLCEAITALTGRRLCMTFGTWRGWKLTKIITDGPWEYLISMKQLVLLASTGDIIFTTLLAKAGLTTNATPRKPSAPRGPPPAESYLWSESQWKSYKTASVARFE